MKVFVPMSDVSEKLMEALEFSPEDLVPFDLEYEVLRPGVAFEDIQISAPATRTA